MSFFGRFFNKPVEPSVTRRAVPGSAGTSTAHQAWALVHPVVSDLDPDARLTLISSGLDMNHKGGSRTWEFVFFLPTHNATVMLSLEPDTNSPDIDFAQSVMTQRINSATPLDANSPAFPHHFRDSPEVVAELSANGVDFVAGPSDMKLEGRVLPTGDAVWVTYYWDHEHTASFGVVDS